MLAKGKNQSKGGRGIYIPPMENRANLQRNKIGKTTLAMLFSLQSLALKNLKYINAGKVSNRENILYVQKVLSIFI